MLFLKRLRDMATHFVASCRARFLELLGAITRVRTRSWLFLQRFIPTTTPAIVLSILSLVVALASLSFTAFNALYNPPNSWFRQHVWPRVDLTATSRDLSIDDQAAFEVMVNTLSAKNQYQCHWTISPARAGDNFMSGIRQDTCNPVPLRNFGTAFNPGEQERAVEVTVTITGIDGRSIGHDSVALRLRNLVRPTISTTPDTIRIGETTQIVANFGLLKSAVGSPYRCAWIVAGNADGTDSCSISYKALKRPDSPAKEIIDVRLVIFDRVGNAIGTAQQQFSVVWPIGDFYMYAIETTSRMDVQAAGVTLASSIANLEKTILAKSLTTGSVGIKAFGRADPPDDRTKCGLVEDVYALAPLDNARVKDVLGSLTVNGFRAPLLEVAENSIRELTKHAQHNVWLYFVMIAGGPDDCRGTSEEDTFNKISSALQSATVRVGPIEIQILGLTLRLSRSENAPLLIERIWNSADKTAPNFQLVVTSQSVLNDALRAVAGLSNSNPAERRASCARLVDLMRQEANLTSNLRERRNPQVAKMESWCRQPRT